MLRVAIALCHRYPSIVFGLCSPRLSSVSIQYLKKSSSVSFSELPTPRLSTAQVTLVGPDHAEGRPRRSGFSSGRAELWLRGVARALPIPEEAPYWFWPMSDR